MKWLIIIGLSLLEFFTFPILWALIQSKPIKKNTYINVCFAVNLLINAVLNFIILKSAAEVYSSAYLLWTSIAVAVGIKLLEKKDALIEIPGEKSSVVTVVAVGIGAALFFVLGRFVAIPSPVPNTNISIQYGLLAFMAALFGPLAGALIGLIGHALIDFSYGWGIWWSWVIASAVFGALMGFVARKIRLEEGEFKKKEFVGFLVAVVIGHLVAWLAIAPVLDIVMYAEPANKVFVQGAVAGLANIVTTAIVGGLLCAAYAAAKPKKGSLKEEE